MNTSPQDIALPSNITDLLTRAARNQPESGLGYCLGGADAPYEFQSHTELLREARSLLTALRGHGLAPRDTVILVLEQPREFLTAFWACLLGGFIPSPMAAQRNDPNRWAGQLAHTELLLDHPLVLTDSRLAVELPEVDGMRVATIESLRGAEPADDVHRAAAQDTAVLMLTSGSTGNSKAVRLSHANLLASMAGKNGYHRLSSADTTFNWVSFDHVAALLECHLLPLYAGANQWHAEASAVLAEPLTFLRLLSRHRVTATFAPNFLLGLLNSPEAAASAAAESLDLSPLRQLISGGEAVPASTGRAFLDRFAPCGLAPGALWPAFGMTETCAGSIYNLGFPEQDRGQEFAAVGTPVEGLCIRVVDGNDRELPEGETGELQLSGPMMTSGYHNNPRATAEAFTADGWFRSGDLGRITAGRLTLVGRSKDSVIVNGVNYFSHEIESALELLDGVARSYVAVFPVRPEHSDTEQLVVAFHPATADGADGDDSALHRVLTAIRSTVVMRWGVRPGLILPLDKEAFPKTSLGKIQRPLMRRRLESGGYDATVREVAELGTRMLGVHTEPEGSTEGELRAIYAELFDVAPESVSTTANFFDLGGTSLDILRLRSKVAQRLGVSGLQVIDLLTAPTVRSLAGRLAERETPGDAAAYDPVVPMQLGGTKTPLFCVHPGVGEVLVFVNLAQYFAGDRPFYALRARGFNEGEKPFATFEEMVDTYVAAIRERQPHGPYAVAGYSYGGAVAFEIAKVLESQGERVDFVGSFNLPPHIKYRMNELDFVETAANLAFFLALIDKKQSLELPDLLRGLPREQQLAHFIDIAPKRRLAELDLDHERFAAWADLADRLTDLGRGYEPSGSVRSMSVFYAIPLRGTKQDWLANELRRWDAYTTEDNRYIDVPGEHYTLMGPRHVAAFQGILRRELDRAMGER